MVCNSTNQAAHYHILGPKLGVLSLTWHLDGLEGKVFSFYDTQDHKYQIYTESTPKIVKAVSYLTSSLN
jgi:hypothetical protein